MHLPTDEAALAPQFPLAACPPLVDDPPVAGDEGQQQPVAQEPAADEPVLADAEDREAMLRDPEVRRALEMVARKRVPGADVADVVNRTLLAGYENPKLPKDWDERLEVLVGTLRYKAVDVLREGHRWNRPFDRTEEANLDAPQPGQASVAEIVSHREVLSKIVADVPAEDQPMLEIYARRLAGESIARMAREQGIKEDTLGKRLKTFSESLRVRAGAIGALIVLLAVSGIIYRNRPKPKPGPEPWSPYNVEPAVSTPKPPEHVPDTLEEAREFRQRAFDACTQDNWMDCKMYLDIARDYDPAGESDTRVQAARKDATEGIAHLKERGNWNPPKVRLYAPPPNP